MTEDVSRSAASKEARLASWLASRGSIAIGFSGGVDSAYLAAVAVEARGRDKVAGIIGRSASYPEVQWTSARAVADHIGLDVIEIRTDELNDLRYAANPSNRCTSVWRRRKASGSSRHLERICLVQGKSDWDIDLS